MSKRFLAVPLAAALVAGCQKSPPPSPPAAQAKPPVAAVTPAPASAVVAPKPTGAPVDTLALPRSGPPGVDHVARAEKLRTEQDFLARELAAALGLGGRPRGSGDPVERARKAVSMRIAAAIKAIDRVQAALARHLRSSVRTGRHCVYEPEDDVTWRL